MLICNKYVYNEYDILQVRDEEIESFTYTQLKDYKKDYLKNPHASNVADLKYAQDLLIKMKKILKGEYSIWTQENLILCY